MDPTKIEPITLGEYRIRTSFNPSSEDIVQKIKDKSAELINLVAEINYDPERLKSERSRLVELSLTSFEQGAMWAVKAATLGKK